MPEVPSQSAISDRPGRDRQPLLHGPLIGSNSFSRDGLSPTGISSSLWPPWITKYNDRRRRCSTTGREFAPAEEFYSALVAEGAELRRLDYCVEAWQGPPPGAVGWWKSQVPDRNAARAHWAPNDVLLSFFDELADQPDKQDMRYVLALLLVRPASDARGRGTARRPGSRSPGALLPAQRHQP